MKTRVPSTVSKYRDIGSYCTRVGSRDCPNSSCAAAGDPARNLRIAMLTGVSVPSTPPSAVPYSDAESSSGCVEPIREPTRSRHCSLNTSPAKTSRTSIEAQSGPAGAAWSRTFLTNGG